MKKNFSAFLIAVCLLIAIPAQAQIKFGVKGGLNLNNASLSGLSDNFKAENMTGFFIGPMLDITVPIVGLGLDASLLYSQKGVKLSYTQDDGLNKDMTNRQHNIDIPINLKYSVGLGDIASIFVAAGPSFSFNVSSDNILEQIGDLAAEDGSENWSVKNAVNKAEIGINLGLGVKLLKHLQVGVNYNIPLTDNAKQKITSEDLSENLEIFNGSVFKTKNKMWQVSIAYIF